MQALTSATASGVTISFGLISAQVSVHGAVGEDDSRSMRTVCQGHNEIIDDAKTGQPASVFVPHAATPVKQKLICPACENVEADLFAKAKAKDDGYVVISDEVIEADKAAATAYKKSIALTVHWLDEVTSVLMPSGKSYYLSMKVQNDQQREAYTALSDMVKSNPDRAFMCKFALRSAVSLFQLTTAGEGTLVLRQMAEASLVRERPSIAFWELTEHDLEISRLIIANRTQPFLVAEHGTGKSSIIAEYAAGQTPVAPVNVENTAVPVGATVHSLSSALEEMLAASTPITTPTKKAIARKRAPRKATAPIAKAS